MSTTTQAYDDPAREVRGVSMFVRNDARQLGEIVARVDAGALRVDVNKHYSLIDIAQVHELGSSSAFRGKVVLAPAA